MNTIEEIKQNSSSVDVYDSDSNGTKFSDHYTVVIDSEVYGMSDEPFHPAYGFCQFVGDLGDRRGELQPHKGWGDKIELNVLPENVLQAILDRCA